MRSIWIGSIHGFLIGRAAMFALVNERAIRNDDAGAGQARESRVDFGTIARTDKLERTPTGGVRVPANIWRNGVLVYPKADGSVVREYRPDSEAFSAAALSSVADAVVTVGHPPRLLTAETARRYSVGHARGDARRDGNFATAELVVLDADAIRRIDSNGPDRLTEISMGYTCIVDPTPGTAPNGEKYDAIQRDIRANHAALLPPGAGRAGRDVALRLDGLLELPGDESIIERADAMEETINGKVYKVGTPEWAAANALRTHRLDELERAAKDGGGELKTKLDAMTVERDRLKTELEAAGARETELKTKLEAATAGSATKLDSIVSETIAVREVARRVLGAETKLDGKSADELRREVIVKLDGASAVLEDGKADGKPRSVDAMKIYFDARMRGAESAQRRDSTGNGGHARPPVTNPNQYTPPGR